MAQKGKIDEALAALEMTALKEALKDTAAGKPLSKEQLRLVERMRGKEAPAGLAVELSAREGMGAACLEWKSVAEVAKLIGVTERWLNDWVHGRRKCKPVLASKKIDSVFHVQPGVAYEHILKHAAKGSSKMHPPPGFAVAAKIQANPFDSIDLQGSPHELLEKILKDPKLLVELSEAKLRAIIAAAGELGRDQERRARMAGSVPADKVLSMLRAQVTVFANLISERAQARAMALLKAINREFGIDIIKQQPGAAAVLADEFRAQGQDEISALNAELTQQCDGLRLQENA